MTDLAWAKGAACANSETALFFPTDARRTVEVLNKAKAMCAGCPVVVDCLEYALTTRQEHGVWGGADESERDRILQARRSRSARVCPCGRLFMPSRGNAKYCGDECRREAHAAQQAKWERANRVAS